MVNYKCNLCNKEFTKKCNYDQHLSRKTNCNKNNNQDTIIYHKYISDISQIYLKNDLKNTNINDKITTNNNLNEDKFKCNICNKSFTNRCNVYRHKKNICNKKNENKVIDELKTLIIKQKDEYDKKINELEIKQKESELKLLDITNNNNIITKKRAYNKKSIKIINTNSNNNNTNITNNIININTIGCENLDKLNNKSIRAIQIADGKELFLKSISEINYNPNIPENHNICYKNLRSNDCYVYDDNKWITMDIKESVKFLLTSHIYHIKKLVLENKNIRMTKLSRDNIILELIKVNKSIVNGIEFNRVLNELNIENIDDLNTYSKKINDDLKRMLYDKTKELNIKTK